MSTPPPSDPTVAYYDANAERFTQETVAVDMGSLYRPFLAEFPAGGHILDAGCGSGRDTVAFLRMGYAVTAFDASAEMARRASAAACIPVSVLRFQDLECREQFDAIWACASLLHVRRAEIDDVLGRLTRALRPGGVWYMSFKTGHGEEMQGGRLFNDYTDLELRDLVARHRALCMLQLWETTDLRPDRDKELWLNVLVRRCLSAD
jgi:SAM-dependent methyltransferase